MPRSKARKVGFSMLGYGAMALYAAMIAVCGLGVFGSDLAGMLSSRSSSERTRAEVQTARMMVNTGDRIQCRSMRFNNDTAELSAETLTECEERNARGDVTSGGSFSVFRHGFINR